jgi:hypothetical protein
MLPNHLVKQKQPELLQEEQVIKQQKRKVQVGKEIAYESPNKTRLLVNFSVLSRLCQQNRRLAGKAARRCDSSLLTKNGLVGFSSF